MTNRLQFFIGMGVLSLAALLGCSEVCEAARDLTSAANTAVSTAGTLAKDVSLLGILCGAVIYQIPGAAGFGQRVLVAGTIGAALAYGGPSLLKLFGNIFGS